MLTYEQSENWKPVAGTGLMVSDQGRVMKNGKIAHQTLNGAGYLVVYKGKKQTRVHRLILEAFVGPPETPLHECAHNNGIRSDNRLENLRWATRAENASDRVKHGTDNRGQKSYCAKITNEQALEIYLSNTPALETARKYGVSDSTVYYIRNGQRWGHVTGAK